MVLISIISIKAKTDNSTFILSLDVQRLISRMNSAWNESEFLVTFSYKLRLFRYADMIHSSISDTLLSASSSKAHDPLPSIK